MITIASGSGKTGYYNFTEDINTLHGGTGADFNRQDKSTSKQILID
jgi:hypothetical protein